MDRQGWKDRALACEDENVRLKARVDVLKGQFALLLSVATPETLINYKMRRKLDQRGEGQPS